MSITFNKGSGKVAEAWWLIICDFIACHYNPIRAARYTACEASYVEAISAVFVGQL